MTTKTKVVISGDSSGAVTAVKRLNKELGALEGMATKALSFSFGGGLAITALAAVTKNAIDAGDALNKMSQKTGMSVEDLSKLQYAADLSGVSFESLQKSLTGLSVGMAEASSGAGPMAEKYAKLGISVRNTDGTMKSSRQVLGELADRFAAMPDGVDKTNLAVDIFGKKLGADMIPLLNGGAAGLKKMGDEAEALGLVMSADFAKASEEFNDNLERMKKLAGTAGIAIGNALIPSLNELMTQLIDANKAGLGFWESVSGIGLSNPFKSAKEQAADLAKEIDRLRKSSESLSGKLSSEFGNDKAIQDQIAGLEKLKKYYEIQDERQSGNNVESAKELASKREGIERQLQTKLAELAQLRGIAEGKVSAEILLDDDKRTAAQIKNAQALRDALSTAWQSSLKDAQAAGEAAKNLFAKAADVRQTGADKAAAKRRSALTPEEQQADIVKEFNTAAQSAEQYANLAKLAETHGRTENAAKLAEQAAKAAERAAKFADQIENPEAGARAVEQASDIQAKLLEQQGKDKEKEQKGLEERAAQQAELMAGLDKQLADLQAKASALKVEADISAAQGAIATLQAQLAAIPKNVTINLNVVKTWSTGSETPDQLSDRIAAEYGVSGDSPKYAAGGYTGPGGKYQPAGIVHAGEYVLRQEVVRQRGALEFLSRFNRVGLSALRGYASGGLVNNIRIPSMPSSTARASGASTGTPINLYLDGNKASVTAAPEVAQQLTRMFRREALKKGGRR